VIRLLALLLLLAAAAAGVNVTELQPQGYISDFAGVLDVQAKRDLEQYCARVEKATGAQIAVALLRTIDGEPVEDFANDLFRHWGIGQKNQDNGLLLLLVVGERRSRLEVGRGLEPAITDGTAGSLLREMRPALQAGRYAEAIGTAVESLGQRIAQAKGVSLEQAPPPRRRVPREEQPTSFPWPALLFLVFLFFVLPRMTPRRRHYYGGGGGGFLPGLILGSMMNRPTYRGHGHGGFGGYDSSDSFGGFGGGDSGGGGASSSW
jgi:uncharacterized protein